MTTKTREQTVHQVRVQDEFTAIAERATRPTAPEAEVTAEVLEKAHHYIDNYVASLKDRTKAHKHRMADARPEAAPHLAGGYLYANCLTVGPIQFVGDPPYKPSKIIAAGEETLMLGVVWINPVSSPRGGWPGTKTLGGRPYRVRFETIDLTEVKRGPEFDLAATFDSPAAEIYTFEWWHTWSDPGDKPRLYEVNFTLDITEPGQPMAAFSTWHYDPDVEPWFLVDLSSLPPEAGIGGVWGFWAGAHWQFERPARFLVYKE